MNIFEVSHALMEVEEKAKEAGLHDNQAIFFYMWLSEDRFPGHSFDDAFIRSLLEGMKSLVKEFDEWAHKEALETLRNSNSRPEPW